MEDKIINIVGCSGSGKTTIAKELEKLGYNIIESYTTRKEREEGEWGHIFVPDWFPILVSGTFVGIENGKDPVGIPCEFKYIDIDEMIAHFNDYEKDEHYFATYEQYQGKGTSIYIVDPQGAEQVKENVKDAEVVTIFLMADEEKRSDRLLKRYDPEAYCQGSTWLPDEVIIRLLRDFKIFKTCKCDYVVDANREIEEVLSDLVEIIGE